jgi:hypothetical protein
VPLGCFTGAAVPIGAFSGKAISVKGPYEYSKNQLGFPRPNPRLSALGLGMTAKSIFTKVEFSKLFFRESGKNSSL